MALEIINSKIVGTIDNLQDKIDGKIPIDRLELIYLVNSWGRELSFIINYLDNKEIKINECKPENCYNLSKLDISQITNLENLSTIYIIPRHSCRGCSKCF